MICRTTIRRFDGDEAASLHTAVIPQPGIVGLRFLAITVLGKPSGRYVVTSRAPAFLIAWAPREVVSDEQSTPAQIDAALASPDHVPLLFARRRTLSHGYFSDDGSSFPVVSIKSTPMALLIRVEAIAIRTHGQITLGWEAHS
jgi:hypothetical protein